MLVLLLGTLFLYGGEAIAAAPTGPSLTLTFTSPDGAPMSGAQVSVYLFPFDAPSDFVPQLLASGTADASGVFVGSLDTSGARPVVGPFGAGSAPLINTVVMAIDASGRWLARYDAIMPIGLNYSDGYVANADLSAQPSTAAVTTPSSLRDYVTILSVQRLPSTDPGGDRFAAHLRTDRRAPSVTVPSVIVDQTVRQVKVLEMHIAKGMHGVFTYSAGQATSAQAAVKVGTQAWSIGGMVLEETDRGASGSVAKDGGYHQLRYAGYRFYEYNTCPSKGPCTLEWRINHWTGDLSQYASASQPAFNLAYAAQLPQNGATRSTGQTNIFGASVNLQGLSLSSKAQYYANTKMVWTQISGCSGTRYLYGQNQDWPVAPTVYATCV